MRIIYFSKSYTPHDHRFLASLAKTKHEIFYLKLEADQRQIEDRPVPSKIQQVLWAGGQRKFRWRDVLRLTFDLRRIVRELKPDLIHAGPIQTCAFIAALSGFRPILTMSWGYDLVQEAERNSWLKWVTHYTLKRSSFFISDARVSHDKAVAFGMDPEKTVIFPWGIDLKSFHPKPSTNRKSAAVKRKSVTLFCNRTWESIYGVDVLARAFVKVAATHPNVDLILLGAGSQGAKIRQTLMNGGVLDRVHFGGHVTQADLPRWYHMADLYISPSHVDGSSVSLMEALASGLPCLVSDIPGNREWITEGENGWLFRDGDADELAEKILFAIKKRRSFKKIGECARKTAEQKADWKKNFGKLLETYGKVLSHQGE
ncbi:MAG TPA: glycosyltransferase family 4 protein [Anaerolineales bacterium]|nr:glycosyltransferase family 4 protein [Anaerolineales bacterium]HLO30455.1 glycosyltransferase family 4 protein [Anaerolineales bacterium]